MAKEPERQYRKIHDNDRGDKVQKQDKGGGSGGGTDRDKDKRGD
jgi:hypothetical protein